MPKPNTGIAVNSGPVTRPPRPFVAGGDLTGTPTLQTVTGIQNFPVNPQPPNVNDVLKFTGSEYLPQPESGGGGGFTPGGDLTGNSVFQNVSFILGVNSPAPPGLQLQFADPAFGASQPNYIDIVNTPDTTTQLVAPRAMVSDGAYLYVGQSSDSPPAVPPLLESPIVAKIAINGGTVVDSLETDLSNFGAPVDRVRELALDGVGNLFATCWDSENTAILAKLNMAVAGWAWSGSGVRAASVCADADNLHFYVLTDVGELGVQRFVTADCLSFSPGFAGPDASTLIPNGNRIRFGGGKIWISGGGISNVLMRMDPVTMVIDAFATDFSGSTDAYIAFYAFGSVWVGGDGQVYRVDPVTLTVVASISSPPMNAGGSGLGIVESIAVGPDRFGNPDSMIYVSSSNSTSVWVIDPTDNVALYAIIPNNSGDLRCYEGIGVLGDNVYFACFGSAASGEGSPGIDYIDITTSFSGEFLSGNPISNLVTSNWAQEYKSVGGDLLGPLSGAVVKGVQGVATDTALHAAVGRSVQTVQTDAPLVSPVSVAYDPVTPAIWVADSGAVRTLVAFNRTTQTFHKYPFDSNSGVNGGLTKVAVDADHVYALHDNTGQFQYGVQLFTRSSGRFLGSAYVERPSSFVLDGLGNLWVVGPLGLYKIVIANMAGINNYDPVDAFLSIPNATDIAWDGTFLYVTTGASSQVKKVDPSGPSVVGTYNDGGRDMAGIVTTPGRLWVSTRAGISVVIIDSSTMSFFNVRDFTDAVPVPTSLYGISTDGGFQIFVSDQSGRGVYKFITDLLSANVTLSVTNAYDVHGTDIAAEPLGFGYYNMWTAVPSSSPTPYITAYWNPVFDTSETQRWGDGGPFTLKYAAPTINGAASPPYPDTPDVGRSIVVTGKGAYGLSTRRVATDSATLLCWTLDRRIGSGNGLWPSVGTNALALSNTAGAVTADAVGFFGKAVLFDTAVSTSGVLATGFSSVEPTGTAVTLSCWVFLNAFTASAYFVAKVYANNDSFSSPFTSVSIGLGPSPDGSWTVSVTTTGTRTSTNISSVKMRTQEWMFVALTWDGNNFRAYLNGTLCATTNIAFGPHSVDFGTHGRWAVGNIHGQTNMTSGVIDDVRVESVVRTQQYLAQQYKTGIGLLY